MRKPHPKGARAPEVPQPLKVPGTDLWVYLLLLAATFAVYTQVRHFDFVNFDDPDYVSANVHMRGGITAESVRWAFTSTDAANWIPLTWLSHMLDCQLFGLRAGWHHLTSVLIHALAVLLLYAFLRRATGARLRSAFVAFLFALHPLHVESVAWIAERKDVLCAFFGFLTLWSYVRYAERPSTGRYVLVLAAFCLGLMSKPILVTLPLLLLLLDVWPLRRYPAPLREKLPFFALAGVAAMVTLLVQRASGAVASLASFPLGLRLENALISYSWYIVRMFVPAGLAVFYPYPSGFSVWEVAAGGLLLAAVSLAVWRWARARPYLAVGWLWYLVTLLPVIGLVQAGAQARADRYMCLPMTGLAIILAWGAADVVRRWPHLKIAAAVVALAACAICATLTWVQIRYWANGETLFRHALAVTEGNYLAHHNLGVALAGMPGRLPDAIAEYQAALAIKPDSARALTDLGSALAKVPGRLAEAIGAYQAALRIAPDAPIPHNDFGNALELVPGRMPEVIAEYQAALRLNPDYAEAHNNMGNALASVDRLPEAVAQFEEALRLQPDYAEAHLNRAMSLARIPGRVPEALAEYENALRLEPDSAEVNAKLGIALSKIDGRMPDAIAHLETALRIRPDYAEAHNNLGVLLVTLPGRMAEAVSHFETAARIDPDYFDAHYNLGIALSQMPGRMPEALDHLEAAERLKPEPELRESIARLRSGRR